MKKILVIALFMFFIVSLFTGCIKETVKVTGKEPTMWMTTSIVGGSVYCLPHHGWNYTGVNSDYEEISWRSSKNYEIGEEVAVIH